MKAAVCQPKTRCCWKRHPKSRDGSLNVTRTGNSPLVLRRHEDPSFLVHECRVKGKGSSLTSCVLAEASTYTNHRAGWHKAASHPLGLKTHFNLCLTIFPASVPYQGSTLDKEHAESAFAIPNAGRVWCAIIWPIIDFAGRRMGLCSNQGTKHYVCLRCVRQSSTNSRDFFLSFLQR